MGSDMKFCIPVRNWKKKKKKEEKKQMNCVKDVQAQ